MTLSKSFVNALGLGLSSGLNFLALMIWTRFLSPAEFGLYTLLSATILFVNAIVFEWLRQAGLRLLFDPADPLEVNFGIGNAVSALCLAVVAALFLVTCGLWITGMEFYGQPAGWWPTLWLWLTSEMLFAQSAAVARSRLQNWRFFWLMSLRAFFSLLVGLVLVLGCDLGALGVALGIFTSQMTVAVLANAGDAAWRRLRPFQMRRQDVVTLLVYGMPLIVSSGMDCASLISDRFIVSFWLGTAAAGHYAVSVDLMQKTVVFLMMAVNISAYPGIVRAFECEGQSWGERRLAENLIVLLLIAAPAAAIFATLSPGLAHLFVGESFRASVSELLPWVAVTAILRGLTSFHLFVALQAAKRTKLLLLSTALTLALLIPAALAGVSLGGLKGMVISVMLAQGLSFTVFTVIAKTYVRVQILTPASLVIGALSVALVLALLPFRSLTQPGPVLTVLAVAVAVYSLILWRVFPWLMRNCQSP